MAAPLRITRPDVVSAQAVAPAENIEFKFYLSRLLKMIPAEVISLYLVGSGLIPEGQLIALTVWAVICLIGVVIVRIYGTADPAQGKSPDWIHIAISVAAFIIWIYSLGGPFVAWNLHVPWVGSLLVLTWTFFVPLFYKGPAGG